MSRRVQQTTLGMLFMTLVCGINELQWGVCVMGNQLLHPRETLGVFEATAESVAVALVTDLNVVNLVLIQQHQGEGVLD